MRRAPAARLAGVAGGALATLAVLAVIGDPAPGQPAADRPGEARSARIVATAIVEHPRFAAIVTGVGDALSDAGLQQGVNLDFRTHYVDADPDRLAAIGEELAAAPPDVALALSAPVARAFAALGLDRPIVLAAIAPAAARDIVATAGAARTIAIVETPPLARQLELAHAIARPLRTIVVPHETTGVRVDERLAALRAAAARHKLTVTPLLVAGRRTAARAVGRIAGDGNALFLASDLLAPATIEAIVAAAEGIGLPALGADNDAVLHGAIATVIHDPYFLGRQIGQLIVDLLAGADAGAPGLRQARAHYSVVNAEAAFRFGIELPDALVANADRLIVRATPFPPLPARKPAAPHGAPPLRLADDAPGAQPRAKPAPPRP